MIAFLGFDLPPLLGTALGVMTTDHRTSLAFARLSPEARRIALEPEIRTMGEE